MPLSIHLLIQRLLGFGMTLQSPYLIAYYQKQNDPKNKVEFYGIKVSDYIDDFNNFFQEYAIDDKNNYC